MWKKVARWYGRVDRWTNTLINEQTVKEFFLFSRPLFTYWVTFVQLFIMILAVAVYGFAPLRYTPYTERALVMYYTIYILLSICRVI